MLKRGFEAADTDRLPIFFLQLIRFKKKTFVTFLSLYYSKTLLQIDVAEKAHFIIESLCWS